MGSSIIRVLVVTGIPSDMTVVVIILLAGESGLTILSVEFKVIFVTWITFYTGDTL